MGLRANDNPTVGPTGGPLPTAVPTDSALGKWSAKKYVLVATTPRALYLTGPQGTIRTNRAGDLEWFTAMSCSAAMLESGILYAACGGRLVAIDTATGETLRRSSPLPMFGVNSIQSAGPQALAVNGWIDGAALQNRLLFMRLPALTAIGDPISDATYLGMYDGRPYVDDWCCHGRADEYRPATIYSVSLTDGTSSDPVDLAPEPALHPARMQPLGQGARNYLRGHYFYVVVGDDTYRYDLRDLKAPFVKLKTAPS